LLDRAAVDVEVVQQQHQQQLSAQQTTAMLEQAVAKDTGNLSHKKKKLLWVHKE
jgi:hypothetical protein